MGVRGKHTCMSEELFTLTKKLYHITFLWGLGNYVNVFREYNLRLRYQLTLNYVSLTKLVRLQGSYF